MVRAVVLAAGASSRMGRPKPTLLLDGRGETFLTRIVRNMIGAGLPDIVVVTGAHQVPMHAVRPGHDRRVRVAANPDWVRGQLSSLLIGVNMAAHAPIEAVAMTLVDVPLVRADTIARLVHAWRQTRAVIVRPARGEEHGHPVIFDCALFEALRQADVATGAKQVVRAHAGGILNVPIDDPGAFEDIDTPEDYARIAP